MESERFILPQDQGLKYALMSLTAAVKIKLLISIQHCSVGCSNHGYTKATPGN